MFMKIRNLNDLYELRREPEPNTGDSLTIPDQTLTVQEIFKRHTLNLGLPQKQGFFDGKIDFEVPENLESMSKTELAAARAKAKEKVTATNKRLQAIAAAKAKAERELNAPSNKKNLDNNKNLENEKEI